MTDLMIVDDHEIFRDQLKSLNCLKNRMDITLKAEAENGVEALKLLRNDPVDILITDINMPEMNGLELLKYVKKEKLCKCAILMSRHTSFEYARKGIILGAFDYMVKPVKEETFDRVINRAIGYIYSRNIEESFGSECEAISRNILTEGTDYENLVETLMEKCHKKAGSNFILFKSILSDLIRQIYMRITKRRKNLILIIRNIDDVCRSIFQADEYAQAEAVFKDYIAKLHKIVKDYYPTNMSLLAENAVDYIFDHLFEKITLTDVADFCFVSNAYLSHCFKKSMGKSFVDYITFLKMQVAKKMLAESQLSISEIAEKLGYEDYKYMGRIFKNICGVTLSEYRKKVSKKKNSSY